MEHILSTINNTFQIYNINVDIKNEMTRKNIIYNYNLTKMSLLTNYIIK